MFLTCNAMKKNKLGKPFLIQLDSDQEKALNNLKKCSVKKASFVRQAVQEKLLKDYRKIINDFNRNRSKTPF